MGCVHNLHENVHDIFFRWKQIMHWWVRCDSLVVIGSPGTAQMIKWFRFYCHFIRIQPRAQVGSNRNDFRENRGVERQALRLRSIAIFWKHVPSHPIDTYQKCNIVARRTPNRNRPLMCRGFLRKVGVQKVSYSMLPWKDTQQSKLEPFTQYRLPYPNRAKKSFLLNGTICQAKQHFIKDRDQ